MSRSIHQRPIIISQYRFRREQAQATINRLLALSKKVINTKVQIHFFNQMQETQTDSKWSRSQIFDFDF